MRILICVATIVFSAAASSFADQTTAPDSVHEKGIERQLALIAPHAVPAFQEATRALASGDAVKAARLYDQVLAEAPSFSPAMRRCGIPGSAALRALRRPTCWTASSTCSSRRATRSRRTRRTARDKPGSCPLPEVDHRRNCRVMSRNSAHPQLREVVGEIARGQHWRGCGISNARLSSGSYWSVSGGLSRLQPIS